jgi:hypothetical protein
MKKNYDLVWFAKYRCKCSAMVSPCWRACHHGWMFTPCPRWFADRYPNHEASERIDQEHKEEIEKLRSDDGDFYHGFNSGLLAAARMFQAKADILHINEFEVCTQSSR